MYPKRILLRYLSGISYRRYTAYIQRERKSVRAISYGDIQSAVRNHFLYILLLRRNAHLSRNDNAHGNIRSYFVAEKPA